MLHDEDSNAEDELYVSARVLNKKVGVLDQSCCMI